jgi:hypothetical protein
METGDYNIVTCYVGYPSERELAACIACGATDVSKIAIVLFFNIFIVFFLKFMKAGLSFSANIISVTLSKRKNQKKIVFTAKKKKLK